MRIPVQAHGACRKTMALPATDGRGVQPLDWVDCALYTAAAAVVCAAEPFSLPACVIASAAASKACADAGSGFWGAIVRPFPLPLRIQ